VDLVLEVGQGDLDNIFTTGSHFGCTYHFSFVETKEMVRLPPHILWTPLSGNHIHWHSQEKARILAYWLSKKEKREV